MSQKLPLGGSKWIEETCQFNENLIKRYYEDSNIRNFIETDVKYPRESLQFHTNLPFLPKIEEIEKVEKLVADLYDKKNIFFT